MTDNKTKTKNYIVTLLTKIYNYCKSKGWNDTIIKVVIGAIFGIAATFLLTDCSVNYKGTVNILPIEETK